MTNPKLEKPKGILHSTGREQYFRFHRNKRTRQRLFSLYVGVSPKWVIKRFRLHEAAAQLASGKVTDWPTIALELGYFDQAHFIKDFNRMVRSSPAEYAKRMSGKIQA